MNKSQGAPRPVDQAGPAADAHYLEHAAGPAAPSPEAGDPGWKPLDGPGPYTALVGPIYRKDDGLEDDEPARFGFRVEERHCNLRQVSHGGMIATFIDVALARGMMAEQGYFSPAPTISMAIDYLAPARLGDWIESRVRVVKMTRNLCFVEMMVLGSEGPVARANGVYKRTPPVG